MSCDFTTVRGPNGELSQFIICSRGNRRRPPPCVACGKPSTLLCDYPLRGKKQGRTCDRALCDQCTKRGAATQLGAIGGGFREVDTFDLCPTHARMVDGDEQEGGAR